MFAGWCHLPFLISTSLSRPPQPLFIPLYIPSTTLLIAHSQHLKRSQTSVLIDVNRVWITRKHRGVDPIWTSQEHTLGHTATNVPQISPVHAEGLRGGRPVQIWSARSVTKLTIIHECSETTFCRAKSKNFGSNWCFGSTGDPPHNWRLPAQLCACLWRGGGGGHSTHARGTKEESI